MKKAAYQILAVAIIAGCIFASGCAPLLIAGGAAGGAIGMHYYEKNYTTCPYCKKRIKKQAAICPYCQSKIPADQTEEK